MTEEEKVPTVGPLKEADESEVVDITQRIDEDLYAAADLVVIEDEMMAFDSDLLRQELARDTGDLVYRPPVIAINHQAGTFDLSGAGVDDYSPKELKLQVIDHAKNRAFWPVKTNPENKMPICSSFDAINGSYKLPDGSPVPCAKCVYGQWWDAAKLMGLVKAKGPKSAPAAAYRYLNENFKESDGPINSVEEAYKDNPEKNLPPCCKEVRRLFAFAYDYAEKGVLNQPIILQVPTSSISIWDKYRQDLALRTVQLADKRRIPLIQIAAITSVKLETTKFANRVFSKLDFSFDRIASAKMTKNCLQIRTEKSEQVMKFQMTLADFDVHEAIDPTSLDDLPDPSPADTELGETMVLDEEGNPLDDITRPSDEL